MAHDLIFYEKRSTPKVVKRGESFEAPESYGRQTKRRHATEDEEEWMRKNPGKWLRVDQSGKKGGQPGYKKTRMAGREHLVQHSGTGGFESPQQVIQHYGVKGMKWGVRKDNLGSAAKSVVKTTGKIAVRAGVITALSSVGVPVVVAAAANPELISAGRDYAKLVLDEVGLTNMSAVDRFKAETNVQTKFRPTTTVR